MADRPGRVRLLPRCPSGDDIEIFADETRNAPVATLHTLRQQMVREAGKPNLALADFIAPEGMDDYIGGFVVTTGHGEEPRIKPFEADKDDYSAILFRALADRLAEAFAERLHAACAANSGATPRTSTDQ